MNAYSKMNRPIHVVDYDPQWPILFEQEKQRISAVLGDKATLIEHIGSTSIPGMMAKPVIDIGVGIESLSQAQEYIPLIEGLGYIYEPAMEQLLPERRFFWAGTPTVHTYHLHMAETDHPVLVRPIKFRDYLRKHPDEAREYGDLKRALAKRCGQDMEAYVSGKTAFVAKIMRNVEQSMTTIVAKDPALEIRPITEDELDDVLSVYQQCEDFLALGPVPTASLEMVLKDIKDSLDVGGLFCGIYETGGKMIGVIDYVPSHYNGKPDTADLELLMIASPYRKQGVGKAVVQAVEAEIRKNPQICTILSGVQVNNPVAIQFWQRNGYRIISGPKLMPDQTTVFDLRKDLGEL